MPFHKIFTISDTDSSNSIRTEKKLGGFMFVIGIRNKPTLKLSWSIDPVFETPVFSKTMARNRFKSILSFLHFNDASTDRLLRPVFERPSDKYIHWYTSPNGLALDEAKLA
jgi:hypothetical protein